MLAITRSLGLVDPDLELAVDVGMQADGDRVDPDGLDGRLELDDPLVELDAGPVVSVTTMRWLPRKTVLTGCSTGCLPDWTRPSPMGTR